MRQRLTSLALALFIAITSFLPATAALPSNVSWTTEIEKTSDTEGIIRWIADIKEGWHIYGLAMPEGSAPPTSFDITPVDGLTLIGDVEASVEIENHYDDIMKLNIPWVSGSVTFSRKFRLDNGVKAITIAGTINYMACNDVSCTPPTHVDFSIPFGDDDEPSDAAPVAAPATIDVPVNTTQSELTEWWQPVDMENDHSTEGAGWLSIFLFGFLGGLLALLTPCVWPLIPMTMSFFLKKGKDRRRSITDAVTYSVSIVVIYLVMGIALTLIFDAGKLNEIATSAVFNLIFFALLVIFAISFFGAFDITLPESWRNKMDNKAESTTGMLSIFFMAFTLVLVSFSCTGPIIGTLLVEAASQASILGPAVGMGGFAIGLALPFGLFAFFPSLLKEMPQSGGWMNSVKVVLGFIELILSLKFLSVADLAYGWHILDREIFLALWIVMFALLGLYLLGKFNFSHYGPADSSVGVFRFFLAMISLSMSVYLLPGLWGAPLKGVSAFVPPLYTQDFNLYGESFHEYDNYEEGMRAAAEQGKPVLIDFSGYGCVNCRKMEGAVLDDPTVKNMITDNFVVIKLMVDEKANLPEPIEVTEYGKKTTLYTYGDKWSYLQRYKFNANAQPYYLVLDEKGGLLSGPFSYEEDIPKFTNFLEKGIKNYSK